MNDRIILIRGAGELATGVAHRLFQCHFKICMTEIAQPLAVRRGVAFCEAIYEGEKQVEGVTARLITHLEEIDQAWKEDRIPLLVDPKANVKHVLKSDVLVDAIIAKKNLGTIITDAAFVIGLGVGFKADKDVHAVIETNRGHNLGRVIWYGEAETNTGIPSEIAGFSIERVLRADRAGHFALIHDIGAYITEGQPVAMIDGTPVRAPLTGVLRGILRNGVDVYPGMKVGDIDPRIGADEYCHTISDKARAIAGGVLEAIVSRFNV